MKMLSVLLVATMVLTSVPVFACGGGGCGGGKDKEESTFTTVDVDYFCGGSCGGGKDKDKEA